MIHISRRIRVALTLGFMALLTVASVIPGRAEPGDSVFIWIVAETPTMLQKSLHVLLYGMLTMLWSWTLDSVQSKWQRLIIAVSIAVCFGATMEWYQTKVPGRFGTIFDVALNAAGAVLGLCRRDFITLNRI